jgi:hypothetical protein
LADRIADPVAEVEIVPFDSHAREYDDLAGKLIVGAGRRRSRRLPGR